MIATKQAFFFLLFALGYTSIFGQACCSGGTPLSGSLDIVGTQKNSLNFRLSYDYNFQHVLFSGTKKLDDQLRSRTTHAVLLRTGYAFSEKIAAYALFSLLQQEELNRNPVTGNDFFTKAAGVGDMILALQYQVLNKTKTSVSIAGGAKFPVGATNKKQEETGIPLNPDMQPGTGAWDGLFILRYDQLGLLKSSIGFSFNSTFRLTTVSKRFNNQQSYRFGNEFQATTGFFDVRALKSFLIYPHLLVRYRYTEKDKTNGFITPNTGGHWIYIIPGFSVYINPKAGFSFRGDFPVYRNLTGTQLTTSIRVNASLFYHLSLKKSDINQSAPRIGI